ncbi:An1-Type Zinc Finger Protein 2A [Manis pentadactyla]|nr:An1-Type Zinc Finger Protein 2A [Manis pentadactyla]
MATAFCKRFDCRDYLPYGGSQLPLAFRSAKRHPGLWQLANRNLIATGTEVPHPGGITPHWETLRSSKEEKRKGIIIAEGLLNKSRGERGAMGAEAWPSRRHRWQW